MKNIHLLPTQSKTRLFLSDYGKILNLASYPETFYTTGQNIYITNSEEIKEGDYVCASGGFRFVKTLNNDARTFKDDGIVSKESPSNSCHLSNYKKIILTTDQDLIKDGVQAIDNDFLEWFGKNPSCEEVDFEVVDDNIQWYKIINPRKNFYCGDEVDYGDKCSEQCVQCVNATGVDYGYLPKEHVEFINDNIDEFDEKIKEFKQIDQNNPVTRGSTALVYKQETLEDIKLEEVVGSKHCRYSVIENKLSVLYRNQEQILKAIKMLNNGK
jgi:hypothetical protein